uniref:sensor histidine kinase n=1 Tax=Thaumasiovibrio occultus TaxID=1891184 RepID=UPI000B3622E9|nr:sensor histidine kinase [Thaumasiovibrio occultus]
MKMPLRHPSFHLRLFIATVVWATLTLGVLAVGLTHYQQWVEWQTTQTLHKDLAAHMRDDQPLIQDGGYHPSALKGLFHTLMLLGPDFEIYLLDNAGTVEVHAAPNESHVAARVDLAPITQFLAGEQLPILGSDPRDPSQQKTFSVAPIIQEGEVSGYLYVVIGSQQRSLLAQAHFPSRYLIVALVGVALVLGLTGTIYQLTQSVLLKPLNSIADTLNQASRQQFITQPHQTRCVRELSSIVHILDSMSCYIQRQFLQLQQLNEQRQAQMLQLNHDLKTPLANILGYLETWQLRHRDDPLITVAYRNAERLSSQLETQLQLLKEPQPVLKPDLRPLCLNTLINEAIDAMRLMTQRKNITICTRIAANTYVNGDHQLLHRLFVNLLGNALRHAPRGCFISLTAKEMPNSPAHWQRNSLSLTLHNPVDLNAPQGTLGMGTQIIDAILLLHQSEWQVERSHDGYQRRFTLPLCSAPQLDTEPLAPSAQQSPS